MDQIKKETASSEKPAAKEGTLSGGPSEPTNKSTENSGKRTDKLEKPQAKEEQKLES